MKSNQFLGSLAALAAAALSASAVSAAPLYSENFDVDPTANWTVNDPALSDITANFNYDYSAIGVPAAPGGASTRGLKMTANNTGGVFSGFSVSPTGQNFTGRHKVTFDLWQNYVGPLGPGGNGTTQLSTFGVLTSGTTAFWPGAAVKESVAMANTLDGGSANDTRAYSSAAPTGYASGNAVYLPATSNNNSNAYYMTAFPAVAGPAAQTALFPGQTGSTDPGEIAFAWRKVVLDVTAATVTWTVDGTVMATVPRLGLTTGGGNIFFGHSDTNAGSSTDPNDVALNVTLIDNVVVVPEPASLGLGALALCGLLAVRRRR
jgi:MYXO-CTERM domain-containing protein